MSKILLINPPSFNAIYGDSKFRKIYSQGTMPLGLCCVAASMIEAGHEVKICDMNVGDVIYPDEEISHYDYIGITATTSVIGKAYNIIGQLNILLSLEPQDEEAPFINNTKFIIGGTHATACPEEVREHFDFVCEGEGDYYIKDLIERGTVGGIPFVDLRYGHVNLDDLPIPAYHLLDVQKYRLPRIVARKSPVAYLQTSRGCYGNCCYCTRGIEGNKMRFKSPERVFEEIEYVLQLGYREIHIFDDNFTADVERVKKICELIIESGLKFTWYPRNGTRVDRGDQEMYNLMKSAGCYRIQLGTESGSQRILDVIGKNITPEQSITAARMVRKAKMELEIGMMIGLPTETEEDIEKTIALAIKLNPDYVKFSNTTPFPGTKLFDDMDKRGDILSKDWSKYYFASNLREVFRHDVLSWDVLEKYARLSYLRFYFRPKQILRLLCLSIKNRTFWSHFKTLLGTKW